MPAPKHNLFALGNNGGRPKVFETPIHLEQECNEYFNWCIENKEVLTITGLCLYLNVSRATFHRWMKGEIDKEGEVFSTISKRAMAVIENAYEKKLDTFTFGGAIFDLKNINKDYWKDKIVSELNQTNTNVAATFGSALQSTSESVNDSQLDKE
jgi:hypothetical protein